MGHSNIAGQSGSSKPWNSPGGKHPFRLVVTVPRSRMNIEGRYNAGDYVQSNRSPEFGPGRGRSVAAAAGDGVRVAGELDHRVRAGGMRRARKLDLAAVH